MPIRFQSARQLLRELELRFLLGGLVLALLVVGDLGFGSASLEVFVWGFCVAVIAGGTAGAVAGLGERALRPLPRWGQALACLSLGGAVAFFVTDDLGAFTELSGRHARLARLALLASSGLGGLWALSAFSQQTSRAEPQGWLASRGACLRWIGRLLLLSSVPALIYVDLRAFPLTYPGAHHALRWTCWWMLLAFVGSFRGSFRLESRRWTNVLRGAVAIVIAFPVITLTPDQRPGVHALLTARYSGLALRFVRALTDVDGDGYAMVVAGGDCAPFDSSVHPGADEIPDNGIDENCLLGDRTKARRVQVLPPRPEQVSPVSVVLVTIDTVRADRMSLYGAERPTTPKLQAWAKSALRYERAYSGGAWTALSLSSLFRGLYPRRLAWGWVYETNRMRLVTQPFDGKLRRGEKATKPFALPIEDDHLTLASLLTRRGMATAAVLDDGRSQFLEKELNIAGHFGRYALAEKAGRRPGDDVVTQLATQQLKTLEASDQPFFLWVHYFDPHQHPRVAESKLRYGGGRLNAYDHQLNETDARVGAFLREVDRVAAKRSLAVALTADHGERFLETHRGHGGDLSDANIRVPLLVRGPGFDPGVTSVLASVVDLFPTILRWTETPAPEGLDGIALQTSLERGSRAPVLSETWAFRRNLTASLDFVSASDGEYRVVRNLVDNSEVLFHPASDPLGDENLVNEVHRPDLFRALHEYLEENSAVRVAHPNVPATRTKIQAARPE